MESGDLKVFHTVAREGSITKAACRLGYVQSNVTARIQNLEQELQTALFHRSKRGMSLTSAGQKLMEHAERILYLLDVANQEMKEDDIPKGSIKLGSIETTAALHLPSLLRNYRNKYTEVKLSLITGNTKELVQKIIHYELDGAFVNGPLDDSLVKQIPVVEEDMVFISEPGSDPLIEVLKKPMLFFGVGCYHRERFEDWLSEEGIAVPEIMEFGSLEAIFGGVAAGIGNSMVPRSAIRKWNDSGACGFIQSLRNIVLLRFILYTGRIIFLLLPLISLLKNWNLRTTNSSDKLGLPLGSFFSFFSIPSRWL